MVKADVTSPTVSVSCPTFSTRPTTAVCPTVTPTAVSPTVDTTAEHLKLLLGQLGLGTGGLPAAAGLSPFAKAAVPPSAPGQIFNNPLAQLGALSPFAALAASNPSAALAALSPALNIFNPAVNPNAALLQFNPGAAPSLALGSVQGPATLPFGKFPPFGKGKFGKGKGFGKGKFPFFI